MPEKKMFQTTDLYIAAYFKAKGQTLMEARELPGGKRMIFCFDYAGQDQEVKQVYMDKKEVKVMSFVNAIRDLKSLTK